MAPKFWPKAQLYEKAYTEKLIAGTAEPWVKPGELDPAFFSGANGSNLRTEIINHSVGKVCLEVGSSIQPAITALKGAKELRIVEPMGKYFPQQFAKLPSNARLFPVGGEEILPQWWGQCDVIYSRNCIDHAEYPLELLDLILDCAAPGCWLMLWCDVWHFPHGDEGHRDISPNPKVIRDAVAVKGFDIKYQFSIRFPDYEREMDYGCVARKK